MKAHFWFSDRIKDTFEQNTMYRGSVLTESQDTVDIRTESGLFVRLRLFRIQFEQDRLILTTSLSQHRLGGECAIYVYPGTRVPALKYFPSKCDMQSTFIFH